MKSPILTIAKYTFFEALKNRLFAIMIIGLVCVFGLIEFVGELAITESGQIQAGITALIIRLFAVFITCLFVITSMVREFNDKTLDVLLSFPVSRQTYYYAKLLGFLVLAIFIVVLVSLLLLFYSDAIQVMLWSFSLLCELLILISLCILFLFTFGSITSAFTTVIAFYLLARSMDSIRLISESPLLETTSFSQTFIDFLVDAIAYVLPGLNQYARTEWLVYETGSVSDLYPVLVQTVIYTVLISAAALFDFYRKNF